MWKATLASRQITFLNGPSRRELKPFVSPQPHMGPIGGWVGAVSRLHETGTPRDVRDPLRPIRSMELAPRCLPTVVVPLPEIVRGGMFSGASGRLKLSGDEFPGGGGWVYPNPLWARRPPLTLLRGRGMPLTPWASRWPKRSAPASRPRSPGPPRVRSKGLCFGCTLVFQWQALCFHYSLSRLSVAPDSSVFKAFLKPDLHACPRQTSGHFFPRFWWVAFFKKN